eukprot:6593168-Pyramimonas_sp.AAC.1
MGGQRQASRGRGEGRKYLCCQSGGCKGWTWADKPFKFCGQCGGAFLGRRPAQSVSTNANQNVNPDGIPN